MAGAEHLQGSRLEVGREAFDMQFTDEKLRHGCGKFAVRKGVPRHPQRVERIVPCQGVAQRLQDSGKGGGAGRQRAGRSRREANGAQRSVIEGDALMRTAPIRHIGRAGGHSTEQVLEQQRIERHGERGAADIGRALQS